MTPFFSIIIPTHLRPQVLRRAIASVLAQTFTDFEIVVVADAMDAGTGLAVAELLRPQDAFYKHHGRPGPAGSRNEGVRLARGEWVLFLDDDDSFMPHHLQRLVDEIRATQGAHPVLFSDIEVIRENRMDTGIEQLKREPISWASFPVASLYVKNFIPNNALAFRRTILDGCAVDPHMASLEDWDFLLSVCQRATPRHYLGGGAVVHKDVNPGTRRGTQAQSNDLTVLQDFLYVYRRWPAPTAELKAQRHALIKTIGLDLPMDWF